MLGQQAPVPCALVSGNTGVRKDDAHHIAPTCRAVMRLGDATRADECARMRLTKHLYHQTSSGYRLK